MKNLLSILLALAAFAIISCSTQENAIQDIEITIDSLVVDDVWAGHPVGFEMVTKPPYQYIAYYDSSRQMTVAQRKLDESEWNIVKLPEKVEWDSHNYIAMEIDKKGSIHVSGNMHGDSLVYFKSSEPHHIKSLERIRTLIGDQEDVVTYPLFFETPEGSLIFQYRIGISGKGNQIYNRYNPETGIWSRLLDKPLMDGKGEMSAYIHGPVLGPDDYYHLIWVWRDTPDAATNHDLSYTKSKDLFHWEKSNGDPQSVPITFENGEIVDSVLSHQGMINGNTMIGFDLEKRPVITYHKYDKNGNTQIFNARLENGTWQIHQSTNWNFRWEFGGFGSLDFRLKLFPLEIEDGKLTQKVFIDSVGVEKFLVDEKTLAYTEKIPEEEILHLSSLKELRSSDEKMEVHTIENRISDDEIYVLRWETLKPHNDLPLYGRIPRPQPLKLFKYTRKMGK